MKMMESLPLDVQDRVAEHLRSTSMTCKMKSFGANHLEQTCRCCKTCKKLLKGKRLLDYDQLWSLLFFPPFWWVSPVEQQCHGSKSRRLWAVFSQIGSSPTLRWSGQPRDIGAEFEAVCSSTGSLEYLGCWIRTYFQLPNSSFLGKCDLNYGSGKGSIKRWADLLDRLPHTLPHFLVSLLHFMSKLLSIPQRCWRDCTHNLFAAANLRISRPLTYSSSVQAMPSVTPTFIIIV